MFSFTRGVLKIVPRPRGNDTIQDRGILNARVDKREFRRCFNSRVLTAHCVDFVDCRICKRDSNQQQNSHHI